MIFVNIFFDIPSVFISWNHPEKRSIEKMAGLTKFWFILEIKILENAMRRIFDIWILKIVHHILRIVIYLIHLVSLNLYIL
jgi:hypothetical protein